MTQMSETDGKPAGGDKTLSVADSPPGRPLAAGPPAAGPQATGPPDRRNQRPRAPIAPGWPWLLVGVGGIIEVGHPRLFSPPHLTRFHAFVPGTLVNVTHTVS